MKKIIVHAGSPHFDEMFACAIAVAHATLFTVNATVSDVMADVVIERRDPTLEELEDPSVLVLDVGAQVAAKAGKPELAYAPAYGNFDHHGLDRGNKMCAYYLLAKNSGLPGGDNLYDDNLASLLMDLYPCFVTRSMVDCIGPFATARNFGADPQVCLNFISPLEDAMLEMFVRDPKSAVKILAEDVFGKLDAYFRVESNIESYDLDGARVVDFRACDPKDSERVSDAFREGADAFVFHDNRGDGYTVLRVDDSPKFDFSKCEGLPGVAFAHKGGFIAKTADKDEGVLRSVLKAGIV